MNGNPSRFIGIGAQRAGTSWLYNCLNEHPEVYMPKKEIHFFDKEYEKGTEWYERLFSGISENHKVFGEFTPDYMDDIGTLRRIQIFEPDVKLLVMLRNPIERSVSAFRLYQSHGRLPGATFAEGVAEYEQLITKSLYAEQLDTVFSLFPEKNVFIGIYDDIEAAPSQLYKDACDFLGVDKSFVPEGLTVRSNSSVMSESQRVFDITDIQNRIHRSFMGPAFARLKRTAPMKKFKEYLIQRSRKNSETISLPKKYKDLLMADITKLENRLNREFPNWKESLDKTPG